MPRHSRPDLQDPSGVARRFTRRNAARTLPWQWLALLGLASGSCLVLPVVVPTPAHAYVARMEITLDRLPNESYDTLLRRAEAAARAAAQRGFDRDVLVSELSIIVMAQNRGLTAPLLTLQVSRMQWRNRPDAGLWITYFRTAKDLLGLGGSPQPTTPTPTAAPPTPQPTPVSTPQPAATTPTAAPPATTSSPAATETPTASPPPAATEASPSPPATQPQQRRLVLPEGSGVPRIPTLPPL
ncbi:hypothetical protein [Trichothermofontia sp.]